MSKVTVFLADRFETVEALAVVDILRRAEIEVETVSVTENTEVMSAQRIIVIADKKFSERSLSDSDMIFLPGGPGTGNYEKNELLPGEIREFYNSGRRVAAICAAPKVLGHLGILEGKNATCFPGCEADLYGANIIREKVVTDGLVTTGIGMGASIEFGLELVRLIAGKDMEDKLALSTQYILA